MIVFEAEDQVGGIAKTEVRDGYSFDLGGHRFFTKVHEVDDLWHEVMKEEFLKRPRMSRIYWNKKFLDYPLRGPDVIKKLGPVELTRALLSYLWAQVKPKGKEETFEQWVTNRFGKRLFNNFFKSYTEKVGRSDLGDPRRLGCAADQGVVVLLGGKVGLLRQQDDKIKSLISEFNYPRYGPGQMWETMTDDIRRLGGQVLLNTQVTKLDFEGERCVRVHAGDTVYEPSAVVSSLPLRNMVGMASPHPRPEVLAAAKGMRYRDFLTVAVVLNGDDIFPDNWIYIHDPSVNVGRIITSARSLGWCPTDQGCLGSSTSLQGDELWDWTTTSSSTGDARARGARPRRTTLESVRREGPNVPDLYAE